MNIHFPSLLGFALILNMSLTAQTTIKLSVMADTELDQGAGASAYLGGNSSFNISPWTTASASKRAVIRFNLSSFPSGCTINSAWLVMQEYSTQGTSRQINVHRLTTDWTEATTNWPSPWISSGGDYAATAVASFTPTWTGVIKQDSVNLTTSVQVIVNGTYPNYGWLLKIATEDATQQYWAYYSKESATAAYRPFLRIRYSGCSVLPIELLDFKAVLKNNQVALSWQTASETNNDFFTIERSEDAVNWMETQHIKGAGNSKILLSYAFTDEHPFAETTYYRLKQTDFDGKFSYSAVQSLTIHDPEKSKIFIYPNPAEDEVRIRTTDSDCSQLKIYDVYGRDMTVQITITTSDSSLCTLHLQNLKPGIYSIHTSATCSKLVKQ